MGPWRRDARHSVAAAPSCSVFTLTVRNVAPAGSTSDISRSADGIAAAARRPNAVPVFHAKGLSKTYHMGEVDVHALRDVDLDIFEREFVVLLGPSGSGKSTLLNILGGLDSPSSGEARWRDHNLIGAGDAELTRYRREHVGFVFQFYNLIPSLTVLENVALQ